MKTTKYADYHLHTSFSDDSTYPMEEAVQRGIALGLDEMCFCEHVDYGIKTDENCDYEAYGKEIKRCQDKYLGQIRIHMGIEFGVQSHTIEQFRKDAHDYPFDFIICSCHQVDNKEFWNQNFQEGKSQQEYNERYYEEILQVITHFDDYSVLGHLDMITRYDQQGVYPFEKVKGILTKILKQVIKQGKGIEVNTSSFHYGLADLTPSKDILKLYRELGGTILTIGSDAHSEEYVADHILEVRKELKALGFQQLYTFDKRKPIPYNI